MNDEAVSEGVPVPKSPARVEIGLNPKPLVTFVQQALGPKPDASGCLGGLARLLFGAAKRNGQLLRIVKTAEKVFDDTDEEMLKELFQVAKWKPGEECRQRLEEGRSMISRQKDIAFAGLAALLAARKIRHDTAAPQYVETSSGVPQTLDCRRVPWPRQPYLYEEPYGISVRSIWDTGRTGQDVAFVLVDEGVDMNHPDLCPPCPIEGSLNEPDFAHHGTKALGIVAAKRSDCDVTGIAYGLGHVGFSSVRQKRSSSYNEPRAILRAIYALHRRHEKGKVLLIERFMNDRSQDPIVVNKFLRCLIKLAVDCKIVVVLPAGNGQEPLDKSAVGNSGAIIVGAVIPLYQDPRHKDLEDDDDDSDAKQKGESRYRVEEFSNHGEGVDCYAWGRCIRTTAFNGGYSDFDGTSGAAAIVAGMAALIQSVAIERHGVPLPPEKVRTILSKPKNGYKVRNEMGRVPSLKKIMDNIGDWRTAET